MPESAVPTQDYQAVAFHHFEHEGAFILFDVDALCVHDSVALDREILESATEPRPPSEINRIVRSADQGKVSDRIDALIRAGILRPKGVPIKRAPLAPPTNYATFMVNVSQRCNLTCSYCYVNKGHFDYIETPIPRMPIADAEQLVDRVHQHFPDIHIYGYHFYGGEPLLNFKAICTIVETAERKAKETGTETDYHITTNGTLLTPEIADFMDEHRFTVYYSIDSNQETHDEFRLYLNGNGSFADVEQNLAYLRQKTGVHLIGSSVVREGNSLSSAMRSLKKSGAKQCKAERVRLHDRDSLSLQGDAFDTYLDDIRMLVSHYIDCLERSEKPADYRLTSKILQLLTRKRRDFFCPAGERMFGVSSNGELYPCSLHVGRPQSKIGNIVDGPDSDAVASFRKKFSSVAQVGCHSCWNRTLCGGGCSAMVDRFGHENCESLRAESEAAILVYYHFVRSDPVKLLGLVSPKIVQWANGEIEGANELALKEPAAELDRNIQVHG